MLDTEYSAEAKSATSEKSMQSVRNTVIQSLCVAITLLGSGSQAYAYKVIPETEFKQASRMNLDCTFVAGIVSDIIKHRAEYKKAHNGADLSMTQFLKIYDEEPLEIPDTIGPNKAWYKLVSRPVATTFYTTELIDTDPRFVVDQMRAMCLLNPKKYYVASQLVDMKQ